MAYPFTIVDVFTTDQRYTGNQLAVIERAADLSDEDMLRIAQEMNYSETTFILSDTPRDNGYDVRIFTTVSELPFAGHPTLGTAYVIRELMLKSPADTINLNLKVGQIPVTQDEDGFLWMRQREPQFGATYSAPVIASVLGIEPAEVDDRFPVQSVSTGLGFIVAPLKSLHAVRRAVVDLKKFDAMIASADDPLKSDALLIFSPETYAPENDLNARVFVHHHGSPEDPATGSANGCLAGYLAKHRYFGQPQVECRVEQGYEINRPSLLRLRATAQADAVEVNVGGRVILVARGELLHS
ncbi:MAG: PhzF family phenazine biosynthesis protein [Anaerolineae bacterium]